MKQFIYRIGYLFRLAIYAVRLLFFWAYRFVLFSTKPGARFIVPFMLLGGVWYCADWLDSSADVQALVSEAYSYAGNYAYQATGTLHRFTVYPPSTVLYGAVAAFAVLFYIFSRAIRPIVAAFPIMSPPMFPRFWLPPPAHSVPMVKAAVAVPTLTGRAWDGNEARLNARLPVTMRSLLETRSAPERTIDAPRAAPVREDDSGVGMVVEPEPAPPSVRPSRPSPAGERGRLIPPVAMQHEVG